MSKIPLVEAETINGILFFCAHRKYVFGMLGERYGFAASNHTFCRPKRNVLPCVR